MFKPARWASVAIIGALLTGCSAGVVMPTSGPAQPPQNNWPQPPRVPPPATPQEWPGQPQWPTTGSPATQAPASMAPYPDNNFEDSGVNPYVDPQRDQYSTFAMDVDTASYAVARRYIEGGNLPDRDSVRLEEFVNAFDYGYRPPLTGAFAIDVEGAPSPFVGSAAIELRIGIQARDVTADARPPASLTFVIDTSGSMQADSRLELVKAALGLLVSRLRPDDSVAIVRFGDDAQIVLKPTSAAEPQPILAAIASLSPGGSTNAQAGLELGYDVAALGHRAGASDRVVLASDGVANVGLTDATSILARIDSGVGSGIELVSIGVGMGNFNDALLEQLADRGNGFYAYINDRTEAEQVFGRRLTGTLMTVAREARVQVEFDPAAVLRYRLLGYENRAMADSDFSNPAADAGEVGAGHSVTALYEIEPAWGRAPSLGTVRLHWIDPDTGDRRELTRSIGPADLRSDFESTSASFQLATTVGGFAEVLRQSPYARGFGLAEVARAAAGIEWSFDGQQDVRDFVDLASAAARIGGYSSASDW